MKLAEKVGETKEISLFLACDRNSLEFVRAGSVDGRVGHEVR